MTPDIFSSNSSTLRKEPQNVKFSYAAKILQYVCPFSITMHERVKLECLKWLRLQHRCFPENFAKNTSDGCFFNSFKFILMLDPNACYYNCSTTWRPVCGNNHLLYSNECVLQRATCKQKKAIVPVKSYNTDDDCSSKHFLVIITFFCNCLLFETEFYQYLTRYTRT